MASAVELIKKFIERLTGAAKVTSTGHAYIHDGLGFHIVNSVTINDGATLKFNFKTPDADTLGNSEQKYIHWRPASIGTSAAGISYSLYKQSTSISGGTDHAILNMNHNSSKTSNMQEFKTGVTATEGTLVQTGVFGTAGNPAKAAGGGGGEENEQVLLPNAYYTINLVNLGGSNSTVTYDFFWYEEADGLDEE